MQKYHLKNRPNREIIDKTQITAILKTGKYATISMCRGNEPYIVTLSYGYDNEHNSLYFHCSPQGLKLDFIRANPLVCATIIEDGGYVVDECGHNYQTVVIRGKMEILKDIEDKKLGMSVILNHLENKQGIIQDKILKSDDYYSKMEVLRLNIIQIQGKAGR